MFPNRKKSWLLGAVAIIGIILIGQLTVYAWWKSSLPEYDGSLKLAAITEEVEILRDNYGMPHIYAKNELDLNFALGYSMAQDRLLQMDLMRRATQGQLAEVIGEEMLESDKLFRTLKAGISYKKVEKNLPPNIINLYKAFAQGISYYIENSPLPASFSLLGYKPKPWKYSDVLDFHYLFYWLINVSFTAEITCHIFAKKFEASGLNKEKIKALCPRTGPKLLGKDIQIVNSKTSKFEDFIGLLDADAQARNFLGVAPFGASNSWVISGKKSVSGQPLLANDTHLQLTIPNVWYEVHLVSPKLNASGITLPGAPHILAGANTNTAWGITNALADESDLYIEKIHPKKPDYYLVGNTYHKMQVVNEKIKVKGQKDHLLRIGITRHGPIINNIFGKNIDKISKIKNQETLALRWTARENFLSPIALYKLNHSKNVDDIAKASRYFAGPPANWVYMDKKGNIGYSLAGCVPKRLGFTGFTPLDGASNRHEWGPCLDLSPLQVKNPKKGWIATTNNKHSSSFPHTISHYYFPPHRSLRINEFMNKKDKLSIKDFQTMQADTQIIAIKEWRTAFEDINPNDFDSNDIEREGLKTLIAWDGSGLHRDKPGATIFFVCLIQLIKNLFGVHLTDDEMKLFTNTKSSFTMMNSLRTQMLQKEGLLFDDPQSSKKENRNDVLSRSLKEALQFLNKKFGSNIKKWDWGKLHRLTLKHPLSQASPIIGWILNRGPYPVGGGYFSLNMMSFDIYNPSYDVLFGSGMRYIINIENIDQSLRITPSGTSGNFLSPYYDDQTDLFINDKYRPFTFSRDKVLKETKHRLLLNPLP